MYTKIITASLAAALGLTACGLSHEPAVTPHLSSSPTAAPAAVKPQVDRVLPHNDTDFTEGLLIADNKLVETTGKIGESRIVVRDLDSGLETKSTKLPTNVFGEGVARKDDMLFVLTWKDHRILRYSWPDLTPLSSLPLDTDGWGATYGGMYLWTSDGSNTLYARNPNTGETKTTIAVTDLDKPVSNINELEYDAKTNLIWANIWMSNSVIVIDPNNGRVVKHIDISELHQRSLSSNPLPKNNQDAVPNGIAINHDGTDTDTDVYFTGKNWSEIYQTNIPS